MAIACMINFSYRYQCQCRRRQNNSNLLCEYFLPHIYMVCFCVQSLEMWENAFGSQFPMCERSQLCILKSLCVNMWSWHFWVACELLRGILFWESLFWFSLIVFTVDPIRNFILLHFTANFQFQEGCKIGKILLKQSILKAGRWVFAKFVRRG